MASLAKLRGGWRVYVTRVSCAAVGGGHALSTLGVGAEK